ERVLPDAASDERRVRARVRPNDDVVTFIDEIDVAGLGDDLELDFRVAAAELRGELPEYRLADEQRHADPQPAARLQRALFQTLPDLDDLGDERARSLVERAAVLGQLELASAALEQAHTEAFLECHHAAGQRRLRPSAHAARVAEAARGRDEVEVGQQAEVDSRVIHKWNNLSIVCGLRTET